VHGTEREPRGRPQFDFTRIGDEDFELLCFLVVLLDHPDAERLRPPDHGADAALESPTAGRYQRCWQFKHYTNNQIAWNKCEESLDRAVQAYGMPHFTFVFARDVTGTQKRTFRTRLQRRHASVKVDHIGSSQLVAKLLSGEQGARIANHFFEDPSTNAQTLMAAIRSGGALEHGSDAHARLQAVGDFLARHDPFFEYPSSIHETGGTAPLPWPNSVLTVENIGPTTTQRTDVIPRNPEALERYGPALQILFDDSAEGAKAKQAFEQTMQFGGEFEADTGTRVELTRMPPLFQDHVGTSLDRARITVKRPPIPVVLEVGTDAESAAIDLDLHAIPAPTGWDGAFAGTVAGVETLIRFRRLPHGGEQHLTWTYRDTATTARGKLEALRFAALLHEPGVLRIKVRETGEVLMAEQLDLRTPPPWIAALKTVFSDIVAIEDWADIHFDLPEHFTRDQLRDLAHVAFVVKNRQSRMNFEQITLRIPPDKRPVFDQTPVALQLALGTEWELFGTQIVLGYLQGEVRAHVELGEVLPNGETDITLTRTPRTTETRSSHSSTTAERRRQQHNRDFFRHRKYSRDSGAGVGSRGCTKKQRMRV
jgi:hypothetical protein